MEFKKDNSILLGDIKKHMMNKALGPQDRRQDILHPSEMAKADWCPRASYYRIKTGKLPEKNYSFIMENIFDEGHSIHAKWQNRLREMGRLAGVWYNDHVDFFGTSDMVGDDCKYGEVPLECEDLLIYGHADGMVPDINALIEIKSIGMGTLRFEAPKLLEQNDNDPEKVWKNLRKPLGSHIKQASLYLWLAREMGYDVDKMVFIYEFKPNQQVKEFVITLSMDVVQPLLDKAQSVVYALNGKSGLPPCPFNGCAQCQELENGEKITGQVESDARDGGSESRGNEESGQKRSAKTSSTRHRNASNSGRTNRPRRLRTNGSVSETDSMGELSRGTTRSSSNRRKVR